MAGSIAEFRSQIIAYPNARRVQDFCRPDSQGGARCKYLSGPLEKAGGTVPDYHCEIATLMGRQLDYHQRHEGVEGDGNCSGTLGFIIEKQQVLMGSATVYHKESEDTPEVFSGISVDNGMVLVGSFNIPEEFVTISVQPDKIVFTTPDSSITETVFLEKPQESEE